jgi:hypothetical protein
MHLDGVVVYRVIGRESWDSRSRFRSSGDLLRRDAAPGLVHKEGAEEDDAFEIRSVRRQFAGHRC